MTLRRRVAALTCSAVLCAGAFLAPAAAAPRAEVAGPTVASTHPWLGFVGRWARHYAGDEAATVNSGSLVRLRFTGASLTGLFDVSTTLVAPQLWVTVDGGPANLVTVDRSEITLAAGLRRGVHSMRIDVKDTDQVTNRWLPPLGDAVVVRGFRLAGGGHLLPPPRARPRCGWRSTATRSPRASAPWAIR